jgi:hypothetical protein
VQEPTLPAWWHALQAAVQAVSQQTPSAQWSLAHSVSSVHAWPLAEPQLPLPSQTLLPVQGTAAFVSCFPRATYTHFPAPMPPSGLPWTTHSMQVPVQAWSQQIPSAQWPLTHPELLEQVEPEVWSKSSVLAVTFPPVVSPPATRTVPVPTTVAVWL